MSEFVFNGNIQGDGHHFGHNYYATPEQFIKESNRKYSKTEKKLIELIFDHFQSEDEKKELLNSLNELSSEPDKNTPHAPIWKRFIKQLTNAGLKEAATSVIEYSKGLIPIESINTGT